MHIKRVQVKYEELKKKDYWRVYYKFNGQRKRTRFPANQKEKAEKYAQMIRDQLFYAEKNDDQEEAGSDNDLDGDG